MGIIQNFFDTISFLTWGWALVPLLVVLGIFITILTGFSQFRFFGRMFRVFSEDKQSDNEKTLNSRQALIISIGGRVGGGNIAGVAVAMSLGGPGAVFWMWAIALIGMGTSILECSLAQIYKRRLPDGSFTGGPAKTIIHGLGENFRWLAIAYSICLIASFAIGFVAFQGNTVAGALNDSLGISRYITGGVLAVCTAFIVFGGIHRIAKVSDIVVPIMALAYVAIALLIIIMNITEVPAAILTIVKNAFGFEEAVGGGIGVAIAQGVKRGLFSNEAGLGSVPNIAATADVKHPISQGITQSFSVFIDTIILCTCTALVIILGDVYTPGNEMDGIVLTQQSLVSHLGEWAKYFLSFVIVLFAFSSIIYNYYLGENAVRTMTEKAIGIQILRIAIVAIVLLGAVAPKATAVFFFSDPMMGLLAIINLIVIVMLLPICLRVLADFRQQLKSGVDQPVFNYDEFDDLDIDENAWKK